MSNLFSGIKTYGGKWSVKESRNFTDEETKMVTKIEVVDSDYGLSACFTMTSGVCAYIPMSNDASVNVGDILEPSKCTVLTLEKVGEQDINRIKY